MFRQTLDYRQYPSDAFPAFPYAPRSIFQLLKILPLIGLLPRLKFLAMQRAYWVEHTAQLIQGLVNIEIVKPDAETMHC